MEHFEKTYGRALKALGEDTEGPPERLIFRDGVWGDEKSIGQPAE